MSKTSNMYILNRFLKHYCAVWAYYGCNVMTIIQQIIYIDNCIANEIVYFSDNTKQTNSIANFSSCVVTIFHCDVCRMTSLVSSANEKIIAQWIVLARWHKKWIMCNGFKAFHIFLFRYTHTHTINFVLLVYWCIQIVMEWTGIIWSLK